MRLLPWLASLLLAVRAGVAAPASGAELFGAYCAGCHGAHGEGGRGVRLTTLTRASTEEALFDIIKRGIPGTEMPPAPVVEDADIRPLALFVRGLGNEPAMAEANGGSAGARVYRKAGCATCHMVGTEGGVFGPDLSAIGSRAGRDYLRRALLDPEADIPNNFGQYRWYTVIPDNFLEVRVVTRDGRAISGARVNEDPFSIQLRDLGGQVYSFWKEDLRELHKDWGKSPMPTYRGKLTDSEVDDLVSYLSSLRGPK